MLSVPFALRPMLSLDRELQSRCLQIFVEEIFQVYRGRPSDEVGAVSVIQRFGSALNLHAHFHVLAMDGRWREDACGALCFQDFPLKSSDIESVSERVADRTMALLRRWGRIEDEHLEWMDAPNWPSPVAEGESGWLVGEHQPLVAPSSAAPVGTSESPYVAQTHGFSVHAGVPEPSPPAGALSGARRPRAPSQPLIRATGSQLSGETRHMTETRVREPE